MTMTYAKKKKEKKHGRKVYFLKDNVNISDILGKEWCRWDCSSFSFIFKDRLHLLEHSVTNLQLSIYCLNIEESTYTTLWSVALNPMIKYFLYASGTTFEILFLTAILQCYYCYHSVQWEKYLIEVQCFVQHCITLKWGHSAFRSTWLCF